MKYLKRMLNTVKKESPILYGIGIFHFFLTLLCLIGLLVDERMLMGVSVWIKPLKIYHFGWYLYINSRISHHALSLLQKEEEYSKQYLVMGLSSLRS